MRRVWVVENGVPIESLAYVPPFIENVGVRYLLGHDGAAWPEVEVRHLCEAFCRDEYELTVLASPAQLIRHLRSGVEPPHVVIFDWEGPGFGDQINIEAIGRLLASSFSYVQVYTHLGAEGVEMHLTDLRGRYGKRLLTARAKNEVTPETLRTYITDAWADTIAGETADAVRKRARSAVERLLIDLCSVRQRALAAMFKGDSNQFVTLVMAKLRDELGAAGVEQLSEIVKGGGTAETADDLRRLQSAFYYYFPQDDLVRTGDLVIDAAGKYGIVITPWCHLESFQKKTGGYLTIVDGYELGTQSLKDAGIAAEKTGESATAGHGKAGFSILVLPNVPRTHNERSVLVDLALVHRR